MLKKVTFSLILLILFSSYAVAYNGSCNIFDENNSLGLLPLSNNINTDFNKEEDILEFIPFMEPSVNLYTDGENVSVEIYDINWGIDVEGLEDDILDLTFQVMEDPSTNVTTLKEGISELCLEYGLENPKITIDSSIGEDQIPMYTHTEGDSMLPTIKSGQCVLVNKSHDIHEGDLVSAESPEYGGICKRVAEIDGDSVYLVSDNKEVTYEYRGDYVIESKGIETWVDISDINGKIIKIYD